MPTSKFCLALITSFCILLVAKELCSATPWKKGYFINNTGDTTYCLIKNEDWKNNPDQFKWRSSLNSEPRIASIEFVSRFMIDSTAFFVRDTIQFETSSSKMEQLSTTREPEFESRTTFLKVLVQGKASLYYYEKGDAQRFFYSSPKQPQPEPLIYKLYKTEDEEVRQNFRYREQIWKGFECNKITLQSINELPYERKDLVDHFILLNQCLGSDYINFNQFRTKGKFKVGAFLAIYGGQHRLVNTGLNLNETYNTSFPWQAGLEFEYLLPFWNNKWSFFLAPSITYYQSQLEYRAGGFSRQSNLEYLTLDMQFAARYYFTIFNDETFFANAGLALTYPIESSFTNGSNELEVAPSRNFIIGLGYSFFERVSAELRYGIDRDLSWGQAYPYQVESFYLGLLLKVNLF